jgi:plasmid stabilization system protein ParE
MAEQEIATVRDWYASQSKDAARRFLIEVERALKHVVAEPLLAPKYLHGTRGYLLRNYRYVFVYDTPESGGVRIFALSHTSRRPGYWEDRLGDSEEF